MARQRKNQKPFIHTEKLATPQARAPPRDLYFRLIRNF